MILIDDGSLDNTPNICRELAQQDNRIRFITQENQGVSRTRINGIALATGKYISFIDADDYISPDFYAVLESSIESENADIVSCNFIEKPKEEIESLIAEGPDYTAVTRIPNNIQTNRVVTNKADFFYDYGINQSYCNAIFTKLYKRELVENLLHRPNYRHMIYAEDVYFIMHLSEFNPKIMLLKYCGYCYVTNPASVTHTSKLITRLMCTLNNCEYVIGQCSDIERKATLEAVKGKYLGYIFAVMSLLSQEKSDQSNKETVATLQQHLAKFKFREFNLGFFKNILIALFKVDHRLTIAAFKTLQMSRGRTF